MSHPDENNAEFVEQWLALAGEDLGLAEHLLSERIYFNAVGFHAQQAAEKYLKAFLVKHQIYFPKTHDLDLHLELVEAANRELADKLKDIIELNDYSVDIRYPGDAPQISVKRAKSAVALAAKTRDLITPGLQS